MDDRACPEHRRGTWPALIITARHAGLDDSIAGLLDDCSPAAIEDLAPLPLPPGGLWDPTFPPVPEQPPGPLHWRVFFSDETSRERAVATLAQHFPDVQLEREDIPDENWAARSQRELRAIRAGSFIVAPPWDRPAAVEPGITTIVIEPSRGFGTGHHASTRLCLRALSQLEVTGAHVLDLGTGSGVLAMAAALKGARGVTAVDVDPDAIEAARASAALNPLPIAIGFEVADFRDSAATGTARLKTRHYDVVLANLTGGMLLAAADRICELLAPRGTIVMSGFDENERAQVREAFGRLDDGVFLSEDGWVGLALRNGS